MIRQTVVAGLSQAADALGSAIAGTEWHLYGSAEQDEENAEDIDLMVLCASDEQADWLRRSLNPDLFVLPLHACFLTFAEAAELDAARVQRSCIIYPLSS